MRKNIFALGFLGLVICANSKYFIEITPNNELNQYEMKVGDIVKFKVSVYEKGETSDTLISFDGKVWWEYDKSLLKKVSSDEAAIELKAIREGIGELSATTVVKTEHCQKKISILITK